MPNIKDGVIQVGFETDVKEFVKEIKKELSSVKDWGLSDALKDEIDDINKMLDGLSKSFSDGMNSKLDTKTFAGFEKKVTAEMQVIDKRVTNLEDSMQALVTTMDSADSSKLTSFLQTVGSQMTDLKQATDATVGAVGELVNLSAKSGGAIQLVDNTTLENLKKESVLLDRIRKVSDDLANDREYDKSATWGKNKKLESALVELRESYEKLRIAKERYESLPENADDVSLARVRKEYTETYAYLNSLRDQFDISFGSGIADTQIPDTIHKILQDSRDEIEGFYQWAVNRLSAVEETRFKLNKQAAISIDKDKDGKRSIKVPMDISTTGRGLAEKARRVLEIAQRNLKDKPLQIDFALQSKYSSKKTNELLKEWQENIGEIDSPELREKFENLYNVIAKDFQKEIKIRVSSNINDEEVKVKKVIEKIKELVGKKIYIFPQFDIKDVDIAKLQSEVDEIAAQLKLNVDLLPKGADKKSDKQLESLKALSDTLTTKLDNLNKNYLSAIKKSLADILSFAQTFKDSIAQTDAPIDELVSSVKELTTSLQKAFGIFTNNDLDGIFAKMQNSVAGISGSLRGGDKNNLVVQLKEILALYNQYKDLGGTKELSDLGGASNVQKWFSNHANDEIAPADPFVVEGKNNANGYAEGIRSGIPTVRAAAKEMAEAALDEIRKTQNSNSPAKETEELGKDADAGYGKGLNEKLEENLKLIKEIASKYQQEVNKILEEEQKPLDDITNKMLADNAKELGLDRGIADEIKDATSETNRLADSMQKVVDSVKDISVKTVETTSNISESADKVAQSIANIIANAEKLEKVDSPLTKKNWSSLNRIRKNDEREDQQTAQNVLDYTKLYMESGQTEILKVIKDYVESSNLKDTLKSALIRTFTSAIEAAEKATVAETESKSQTKTVTMNNKQLKEYLKKYAVWGQNEETFNANFRIQKEAMQKDGRAFREQTKSGKWKAWQYKVEVPVNQINSDLDKVEQKVEEVNATLSQSQKQVEKTGDSLGQVGTTGRKKLDKAIEEYRSLYQEQQRLYGLMSPMSSENGDVVIRSDYKELGGRLAEVNSQMEKLTDRGFSNFKVNLRALALGHLEVADAAQTQAQAEQQAFKAEETLISANITPTLQKHIEKYKELSQKQQEYLSQMSAMVTSGTGKISDPQEYAKLKQEEDSVARQIQKEVERVYKNYGISLSSLAQTHIEVANAAERQGDAETKAANNGVSKTLQKKIDRYKQLTEELNKLYAELSNMAQQPNLDSDKYKNLKSKVHSKELALNALKEKGFASHNVDLNALANKKLSSFDSNELVVTSNEVANATEKAAEGIKHEASEAQKGTKKKEKLAKSEKALAKGSEEAATETDKAAEAIEKEYKNAEKNREKVLREEQKIRRAIADAPRNEAENMLSSMDGAKWQKNFITSFSSQIEDLRTQIETLLSSDNIDMSVLDVIKSKFNSLDETVSNTRLAAEQTLAEETSITGMQAKIAGFMDQNTAMSREFKKQLKDLLNTLENGGDITVAELKRIGSEFNRVTAQVKQLHQTGQSFGSSFLKQLKSANAQLIATYFSFQDFIRYAREGFQTIVEVDTALTELRKVSDASDDRLAQSFKASTQTAKELGSTISDVIGVTADWARLGYNVDQAEELAKVTTLFKTVGDNMSAEDTSSYMVSTLQGFQMQTEQAIEIADKFNEVANNFAIDTAGIGEALKRSSASFNAANTDLSEAIALVTATNTVVQNPEAVGTLWKTLSARIRGAKTELEELDEEEDEFTQTTSKLQGLVKGMTGFDILEEDGKTFKSIYDIILGIGKEWGNLTDIEQASLGEALAGKRNANALYAVLNNIETLEDAYATAEDAQGSAMREQENYAKSIQYSIDVLKASAQEFWTTLVSSGAAKSVIDFLTKLLNILTKIVEVTNGIPIFAGAGLLTAFGRNPQGTITSLSKGLERLFGFFKSGTTTVTETISVLDGGAAALEAIQGGAEIAADGMVTLGTKTVATESAFATLMANPITPWIIGATIAIGAFALAWDGLTTTVAEAQKDLDTTSSKINDLKGEIKELSDLDYRNEEQETRLKYLEKELEYQEKIFDIERKRVLQEKVGHKFSDWFDKDNYNRQLSSEHDYYNTDSFSSMIADYYANQNEIAKLEEQKSGYESWLNHNRDILSQEEIEGYIEQISKLQRKIDDLNDEDLIFAKDLNSKAQEFKGIIDELQSAIDDGILIGSDRESAEKIISEYTEMYQVIYQTISSQLREEGLFDYSSIISSTLNKADFEGVEDQLVELAKEGSLSEQVLEDSFSGLVEELALASVKTEELRDYILELAGLVNTSKLSERIANQLGKKTHDSETGHELNQAKIIQDYLDNLEGGEEDRKIVEGLEIDFSKYDAEQAIAKIEKELAKAKKLTIKADVELDQTKFSEQVNGLDNLQSAYNSFAQNVSDKAKKLNQDISDIEPLRENFGKLKGFDFDAFERIVTSDTSSADQIQEAYDKALTAYARYQIELKGITEENKEMIRTQLEMEGATHDSAKAFVDESLQIEETRKALSKLNYDQLIDTADEAARGEEDKIHDWGLDKYHDDIVNGTIQSKYGNVDMDKRTVIHYNEEILDAFKEGMSSWNQEFDEEGNLISSYYSQISEAVKDGDDTIDTVFGGSDSFRMGQQEVDVAFTPIMVDENGNNPQFLSQGTVSNYIQKVLDQADKEVRASGQTYSQETVIKKAFEIDFEGMNTEEIDAQGKVVGQKYVHGIMAAIGDDAIDVGSLLHFSGEEGAFQLADDAIEVYNGLKEKVANNTLDVTNLTADEIRVLENEGKIASETATILARLALQNQLVNNSDIVTTESVTALANLAKEAGIDIAELKYLKAVMDAIAGGDAALAEGNTLAWAAAQAKVNYLKDNMINEIQTTLDALGGLEFDPNLVENASKAGGDAADAYVESYEKEKSQLERDRDMGIISEKEYLDKLKVLIDKFFKDRAEYAEKYMDEMKDYMSSVMSYYNSVISGVTTLLDHRISSIQDTKDSTISALEEEKEAAEARYQAEIDAIQATIDAKQEEIDKLQEQIDAIDKANEARDRSINLQKAEYELQRMMHQRTKLVYTGEVGQMRYERDESGLRDARENLNDAQDDAAKAKIQEQIDLIEKEIKLLEKQKESLENEMEAVSKYYEKMIKEQEKMFDEMVKKLEETKKKWEELAAIEELSKSWGLVSEAMAEYGYTVEDVLNDTPGAFEAFKSEYLRILQEMHSGDQGFLEGVKQFGGQVPGEFQKVASAAGETEAPIKKLGDTAGTTSGKVSTLGTTASTAATGVGELKEKSEGIADELNELNNVQLGGVIEGPLAELEEKLTNLRDLVGGTGTNSLLDAFNNLNTSINIQGVLSAFTALDGAIKSVVASIGGGGADEEGTFGGAGRHGKNGMPSNIPASGVEGGTGEGLVGAINSVKAATDTAIGANAEEESDTATGAFFALKTAVDNVTAAIGMGEEGGGNGIKGMLQNAGGGGESGGEGTLTAAITSIKPTTDTALRGEDGAIAAFEEFKEVLAELVNLANELLSTLQQLSSIELPQIHGGSHGYWFTGSATPYQHYEGTAKLNGDWSVKQGGTSLVGELGQELVVDSKSGKFRTVGDHGPEFVRLNPGDIVFNHLQTEELLSKKNLVIPKKGRSFANGTLPSGFFPLNDDSTFDKIKAKIKEVGLPTIDGIKTALQAQTDAIMSEVRNAVNNNTSAETTVNQHNTFNIQGVSGEDVARQINTTLVNTFSGMSLNAYQRSMA